MPPRRPIINHTITQSLNGKVYDTANRLVQTRIYASTTRYEYNGDGDRVAETHNGVRTLFTIDVASSLTNVLVEKTPVKNDQGQTITQTVSYTYGLGPVAQSGGGVTEYLLTDGLGSVRQYTSSTGDVLRAQTFDPYGNRLEWRQSDAHWAIASPFGWTGEQSDPNGLTYLRARYYNPGLGRFTQIDPFGGALAVPASMNGYGYAHGNPTRYTDPSGQCVLLCIGLLILGGLAVGFGTAYSVGVYENINTYHMAPADAFALRNINWERAAWYMGAYAFAFGCVGLTGGACLPLAVAGIAGSMYYEEGRVLLAQAGVFGPVHQAEAEQYGVQQVFDAMSVGAVAGPILGGAGNGAKTFLTRRFGTSATKMILGGTLTLGSTAGVGYLGYKGYTEDPIYYYDAAWMLPGILFGAKTFYEGYTEFPNFRWTGGNRLYPTERRKPPLNNRGMPYPQYEDPRTGKPIPFPDENPLALEKISPEEALPTLTREERAAFITEWHDKGYRRPAGGWGGDNVNIHHIDPRAYGGKHDFWNLVPVETRFHELQFNEWWRRFG